MQERQDLRKTNYAILSVWLKPAFEHGSLGKNMQSALLVITVVVVVLVVVVVVVVVGGGGGVVVVVVVVLAENQQ